MNKVNRFLQLVKNQVEIKAKLYDGIEVITSSIDGTQITRALMSTIEEIGEVSSAITRHRYELAKAECVDVAHSALLLYLAIEKAQE